jgi:hypothetical protein
MIREELRAALAAPDGGSRTEPSSPENSENEVMSDDAIRAYDQARATIDDALARGSWTDDDRAQFRDRIALLPKERRLELMQAVVLAVNEKKFQFVGHGSPI